MNLFEYERKLNSKNPKKSSTVDKMYNESVRINERNAEKNKIMSEASQENRKTQANLVGEGMIYSRSALRRKLISEKIKYENLMKETLFKESVFDIFMESLLLDDDFKDMYSENLRQMCYETLDDLMSRRNVTIKKLGENSSVFIQDIVTLCEETAKDEADKLFDVHKVNDKQAAKDTILNEKNKKAKLDEQSKKEFNLAKELDTKSIAEAVKEKVVNVIRQEQEAAEMDDMDKEEIDMETEDPADIDMRTEEELAAKEMDDAQVAGEVEEDAVNDDDFEMADLGEASSLSIGRIRRPNKLQEESLFRSLQLNIASKALKENAMQESSKVNINMDLVLAETLSYYTLLETLHTARIIEFTPKDVRSLAKELVFRTK